VGRVGPRGAIHREADGAVDSRPQDVGAKRDSHLLDEEVAEAARRERRGGCDFGQRERGSRRGLDAIERRTQSHVDDLGVGRRSTDDGDRFLRTGDDRFVRCPRLEGRAQPRERLTSQRRIEGRHHIAGARCERPANHAFGLDEDLGHRLAAPVELVLAVGGDDGGRHVAPRPRADAKRHRRIEHQRELHRVMRMALDSARLPPDPHAAAVPEADAPDPGDVPFLRSGRSPFVQVAAGVLGDNASTGFAGTRLNLQGESHAIEPFPQLCLHQLPRRRLRLRLPRQHPAACRDAVRLRLRRGLPLRLRRAGLPLRLAVCRRGTPRVE